MRDIFNSYNVDELRKFATKYNKNVKIAGASKMKKNELIDALMKHTEFFKDVKKKGETAEKKEPVKNKKPKPAEKKEPVITNIKKVKKIKMNVKGKETDKDIDGKLIRLMNEVNKKYSKEQIQKEKLTKENFQKFTDPYFELLEQIETLKNKLEDPNEFIRNQNKKIQNEYLDTTKNFVRRVKQNVKKNKPKPAEMKVKGKEPAEKKENVKVNPPVFKATADITIDKLVNEFDSPFSANVLSQYSMNKFNNLEVFLIRRIKLNETVDIDQFLSSGVYISKDIVRKLILKYGVKKTFELVKDLLNQIVNGENLKTTVAPEALTNLQKNKTVSKFFRSVKNVKL